MKPMQREIDQNVVNIRIDNTSIKEANRGLEELNDWYRWLERGDWSGSKIDFGPIINRSIMQLRDLEKQINEIQELRWSEGGSGDFSFAEEYSKIRKEIQNTINHVKALEETQTKFAKAGTINFNEHVQSITRVNFELLQMREYYKQVEQESLRLSDSINGYQSRIADLNERWNNMTKSERTSATGKQLYEEYKREADALDNEAKSLERLRQEEKERAREVAREAEERIRAAERAAEAERREQERINNLRQKGIQSRRYENAILNSTIKTMRVLQEQERILSERLGRTQIGSKKYKELETRLAAVRLEMQKLTGEAVKQEGVFSRLAKQFAAYASVHMLVRFVKQIRDVTGELEYQRVALGRLLQDVSYGNYLFERIKEAAIESPFRIKDLVTYTKQLAAYRIEQEDLFDTTKRLADISAGLGVDMNRLILAFGQVRAASVLRGQELRQFTEAGIPLVELLAEKFTDLKGEMVSTADVFKLISERAVPFSMIADIFEDLTDKGGMFYKMQEEQAKTLKGRWEKLKDAYDIALQSVGDTSTFGGINDLVIGILTGLAQSLRVIIKLIEGGTVAWATYNAVAAITATRVQAVATAEQKAAIAEALREKNASRLIVKIFGQAAAERMLTAATTQATIGTNALTRALGRLKVVLLTNPWGVAAVAILGLVTAMTSFKKATNDSTEAINSLNRAIDDMHSANQKHEKMQKLIEQYENLATKAERNSAENETLARTMKKLSAEFPALSNRIDDQNLSLEDRLKLIQDLNSEEAKRLKRIQDSKKDELQATETRLNRAQQDKETAEEAKNDAITYFNAAQAELERLSAEGKKGRGWFAKLLFGENDYDRAERAVTIMEKGLDSATANYNDASKAVEDLTDGVERLKNEIGGYKEETEQTATAWKDQLEKMRLTENGYELFSVQQLEGWHRLYDVSTDLEKEWKKVKVDLDGLNAGLDDAKAKGGAFLDSWLKDLKTSEERFAGLEFIKAFFGFNWGKKSTSGRDTRLSQLKSDISELTNAYKKFQELRKYKTEEGAIIDINTLFPQLKGEVPSLDYVVSELEKRLDQVKADLKKSPKSKTLLDMKRTLETEISNLKFDDLKDKLEKKLKKVSEEVKRSEAARNFYKDIFDLTGDETLATSLSVEVYGGIGDEFKERLQQQLAALFEGVEVDDAMRNAIDTQDFDYIFANLPEGMEKVREELKKLREDNEKFSADQIKTWVNELKKAKTYGDERVRIARTTQERIAEINRSNLPDEEKKSLIAQYVERESKEVAKLQYEAFKDSPMYIALFEDLDAASGRMLDNMRKRLVSLRGQWSSLDPVQLKEMQKRMEEIDSSMARRNPFKALSKSIKEYQALLASGRTRKGDEEAAVSAEQNRQTAETNLELALKDLAVKKAAYEQSLKQNGADSTTTKLLYGQMKAANALVDARRKEADAATKSANQAQENANQWSRLSSSVLKSVEAMSTFSVAVQALKKNVHDIVDLFAEMSGSEGLSEAADLLESMAEAAGNAASGLARVLAGDISGAGDLLSAKMSGIQLILQAVNMINNAQLRDWDRQMEEQEKTLARLQRSYDKLGEAMENAFGSDYLYNYNEQQKNLAAQREAYEKQLAIQQQKSREASRDEDRKAAADEAENLKKQITGVEKQAKEVTQSMQEFFAGTDLTSAAEAFADSWLDAYREFGDTTGAIKEKMQEMIDNLIVKSVLAGAAKAILQPFFDEIEKLGKANDLTPENIAKLATMLNGKVQGINDSMSSLMTVLQSLGIKTRGQIGSFTGIARDIASASEESILGLAAGINTQNYYMSYVPMIHTNLEQVLALMGGSPTTPTVAPSAAEEGPAMPSVQEMIYDHLPNMDRNLADIKQMLSDVIKPVGTSASKYVATRM